MLFILKITLILIILGQKKLKNSRVLIIGVGGLGCPSSMYLASAGVGTIGLVDYDKVELNNLHRQVLHPQYSVGMRKVESGQTSLIRYVCLTFIFIFKK